MIAYQQYTVLHTHVFWLIYVQIHMEGCSKCTICLHVHVYSYVYVLTFRWYCHADDDIYVNIVGLTKMLQSYNPKDKVYLGQWHYLQKYFFHTPRVIVSYPEAAWRQM